MNKPDQWYSSGDAAELYERYAVRVVRGDRVLDIACGTGVVTRIAAQRAGRSGKVTGLDLSAPMLAVARSLPAENVIEWVQGSAVDLGLPAESFDVVLCQQGLQFFPDKPAALREMRRVLDGGGRLALSVWAGTGVYNSAVGKALAELLDAELGARFCASRKVPGREELDRLVADAGFRDIHVSLGHLEIHLPAVDEFVLQHLASTPVASALANADARTRGRIGARVLEALRDYRDGSGVTYPEEIHLVTAIA
jgi:SAM-dependent methyltransferase